MKYTIDGDIEREFDYMLIANIIELFFKKDLTCEQIARVFRIEQTQVEFIVENEKTSIDKMAMFIEPICYTASKGQQFLPPTF